MISRGQISLDFLFALILLFIFAAALQNFAVLIYDQKAELGVRYRAQSLALGISGAENAKQILSTPDTNSTVLVRVPDIESENYGIAGCNATIRPGQGVNVHLIMITERGQKTIDQNAVNPLNQSATAICGGDLIV